MCDWCKPDENYFHSVDCVYDHLLTVHPVLWLRDSSLNRGGYVSRNFLSPAGNVLAIWKGPGKGWKLRQQEERVLDEIPDPTRSEFVELSHKQETFQAFMFINEGHIDK